MKKLIPIIFVLGIMALLLQFFVQIFIKEHDITYSIATDDNSYMIHEKLSVANGKHTYSFQVQDDKTNNMYLFDFVHDYHKQDSIIKDIRFFEYDDLTCIFPIYKNKNNGDIICNYKKEQVSYSYLKQIDDKNIKKIVSKLKEEGYHADAWKKDTVPIEDNGYQIYQDNVPKDIVFTMWTYSGFYQIAKDKVEQKNFLNDDCYENNRSYIIDNYLFSINTDNNGMHWYTDFYIFDLVNGGKISLDFEEPLSKNMYFNGVYKTKLYYTDLDNKKQYSLDPANEIIKEVGNAKDGFKMVKGGSLVKVSAKDFLEDKVYFDEEIKDNLLNELKKKYPVKEIKKDGDCYYFSTDDGAMYQVYATDIKNPILLFQFDSISEWLVKDGNLAVVSHDMLYFYNHRVGLLPIVKNNELNYNHQNICNFIIK